jgi:hypothetical protein
MRATRVVCSGVGALDGGDHRLGHFRRCCLAAEIAGTDPPGPGDLLDGGYQG